MSLCEPGRGSSLRFACAVSRGSSSHSIIVIIFTPIWCPQIGNKFGNQLRQLGWNADGTPMYGTITEHNYAMFQLMFAIITVAIISGSVVGKIKYVWFMAFVSLWHLLVYCPLAHWFFFYDGWGFIYGTIGESHRGHRCAAVLRSGSLSRQHTLPRSPLLHDRSQTSPAASSCTPRPACRPSSSRGGWASPR